ncbi:unnamed protein product, partial [marine sediment metagenome]
QSVLDKEDGFGIMGENQGKERKGYILHREIQAIAEGVSDRANLTTARRHLYWTLI